MTKFNARLIRRNGERREEEHNLPVIGELFKCCCINTQHLFFGREIFVDATRAMSVATGEKDNKQVYSIVGKTRRRCPSVLVRVPV